ncbi:membrane protein [Lactiplantibacillus plantarum EGD-AQ4]|nr:membrane protein [Lactiplantibacillus plantarum EGD-AQ4]
MRKNWFWPIFLIASAVILITSQLGLFSYHLSLLTVFFTLILIAALGSSLRYLNMSGIVFSVAFLAIIYARPLGITRLVPWTILGAALLLSIGLSMLIRPRYYRHHHGHSHHHEHHQDTEENVGTINDDHVNLDISLGNSIRYIHSEHFKSATLDVSMASAKVYFDDVNVQDNQATISVDVSLGSLELYLPKSWQVQESISNSMGHVSTEGTPLTAGPGVILKGSVSLGELRIIYI